MLALLHDPAAPHGLRLGEAGEPEPEPGQVLVEVRAVSLNFGEVAYAGRRAPGEVPGWDAAGIDVATGARVVSFGWGGGWAQRRVPAALQPTTLDLEALRVQGGATVEAFAVGDGFAADLATLVHLRLDPRIGWRGPWTDVHAAIEARAPGKTILEVVS
jgi:NADPH:quinone reductase-like Zn-dependent oxidoreductase